MNTEPDPTGDARAGVQQKLQDLLHKQREIVDRLMEGQVQLKRLARSVWLVQEQERRKLARELHDGIGQNLSAIMNLIDRAMGAHESDREELAAARALVETTLRETRELSRMLRPQILDDLGIESALRWLVRTIGESHAVPIRLHIDTSMSQFDEEISTLVFRLTQEALHNAVRHAKAQQIAVELRRLGSRLHLTISDDGAGCDLRQAFATGSDGRSGGLGGMRDRVRLHEGNIDFRSAPGEGMTVSITVPLPAAPDTVAP
ncbi:MAG TPA: sensor histidine kinase [Rudaea sp.]|nr:sensor histidine kinase [Rudaea sp.]